MTNSLTHSKSYTMARRITAVLCIMLVVAALFSVMALALDSSAAIEEGVKEGSKAIYKVLRTIITPIAAVVFGFSVFKMIMGNEREVQSAKHSAIICVVAIALVWLAPFLIGQVVSWFSGSDATTQSITNVW